MVTKNSNRKNAKTDAPAADGQQGESLDQVRDILFGGQMRAVEKRLERLADRVMREVDKNRDDALARIEALDAQHKKDIKSLTEKLQNERSKRASELKATASEFQAAVKDLDQALASLEMSTANADAELRDEVLTQFSALSNQLEQRSKELLDELHAEARELRSEKTDTAALISLFSDMALRLTEELPDHGSS